MKLSKLQNIILYSVIALGVITFIAGNSILEDVATYIYTFYLLVLFVTMILIPLKHYLFGITGIRDKMIRKGKHYSSILPVLKFYRKKKDNRYSLQLHLYNGWFEKVSSDNPDYVQLTSQVNKIFGINYGWPRLKGFKLQHSNSFRLGIVLGDNNDEYVNLVVYVRQKDNIQTTVISQIEKGTLKTMLYLDFEKAAIGFITETKQLQFSAIKSFYEKKLKIKNFGYFLPRPYYGGAAPAHADVCTKTVLLEYEK